MTFPNHQYPDTMMLRTKTILLVLELVNETKFSVIIINYFTTTTLQTTSQYKYSQYLSVLILNLELKSEFALLVSILQAFRFIIR